MTLTPETVPASAIAPETMPAPTAPASITAGNGAGGSPQALPVPTTPPAPDQLDAGGVAFDPARHIAKKNPHTGRWMPKGGRKPGAVRPASSTPKPPAPAGPPPPSFIPASVPPPPPPEPGTADAPRTDAAPPPDHSDDAAECAAQALQFAAGVALDAHEDCACSPSEHKSMVRAFAAYIRAKGWQATAGVATLLVLCAYILRTARKDKPREKINTWIHGADRPQKDVTPPDKRPAPPSPPAPEGPPGNAAEIIELYKSENIIP